MLKEIIFNGSQGRVEGKFYQSAEKNAPIALVLHPHPLHGGTMNNKVVYNVFQSFVNKGFSVLRFNFRGVGKSEGVFDHGEGELIDAATALDWLQNQCPEHSNCWIAGFSFGAWISLQLLMRRPEIDGFIAVSPPASSYDFNFLSPCPAQGAIIQGTKDEVSKENDVYTLYEKISNQRNSDVTYIPIATDHFYKDKLEEMSTSISDYIAPRIVKKGTVVKKARRDRRRRNAA